MIARGLAGVAVAALLGGCAGKFVHVRAGEDPQYQDDGVRFRTTYYFRVFDHCPSCSAEDIKLGQCAPKTDSLYRFRMTGKSGLITQVHFEAGALHAHEIDPFGAAVVYDETDKRFRFKSQQKSDEDAARRAAHAEIRELRKLCDELNKNDQAPKQQAGSDGDPNAATACFAVLKTKVSALSGTAETKTGESNEAAGSAQTKAATYTPAACKAGEVRRGFQILGPEGWRTFDQDERLVLAMSSSGKPLISTMRELSERVLNQKGAPPDLQPYLREQYAVEKARNLLDAADKSDDELEAVWQRLNQSLGEKK